MGETTAAYTEPRAHTLRDRFRALYGGEEFPVPVESIAEDFLGLRVREADLDGASGLLIPSERRIYLNEGELPARRRFTVAHEIGHWICQCLEGRGAPVMCRSEDLGMGADRSLEREANIFAAELLMPEEAIRAAHAEGNLSEAFFGVSAEALQWRLFSFGLGPRPEPWLALDSARGSV